MFSNGFIDRNHEFPYYNKKDPIINIHLYQDIVYMTLEDNKMENSDWRNDEVTTSHSNHLAISL